MDNIRVREARMDDTGAVCALFRQRIPVWQRFDSRGRVEELPYTDLTLYERWLHGGAWMSIETGALFLSHVLCGAGLAFVAEKDGQVIGYVEVYPGDEAAPYGAHHHIGQLAADAAHGVPVLEALVQYLLALDDVIDRLTVAFSSYDTSLAAFYARFGMQPIAQIKQYALAAQAEQSFYKATDCPRFDHSMVSRWNMPVGRLESARYHWETLWPPLWAAFPEIVARRTHRLQISAAGQEAFVCVQQQLYVPRNADVYCWSPRSLTKQLLLAILDWAYRQGYRSLTFAVPEATAKLLGADLETIPYQQTIYATVV